MTEAELTSDGRKRVLSDGNEIPLLGLGVWQAADGRECEDAVRWALEAGYRHIDTAQGYGNERSVGRAMRDSGVPREDVFITTKFAPARRDPEAEIERSLERLGVDRSTSTSSTGRRVVRPGRGTACSARSSAGSAPRSVCPELQRVRAARAARGRRRAAGQ